MYTVYTHKFPNNKIYVGITQSSPTKRWRYKGSGYKSQKLMWRAIQKYGWDNIEHIIVAKNLTKEEACELEIKLIAEYKSNNAKYGYNVYAGGDTGRLGIPLSKSEKQRLLLCNKGRPKKPDEVNKIKETLSKYWTDEQRKEFGKKYGGQGFILDEKISLDIYAKICNGVDRKDLSNQYNVSRSIIDRIAQKTYWSIRNSNSDILNRKLPKKYIYQYDLQGNFVKSWNTFNEIHKELKINVSTICECCNHKREKTKGYKWKYVLILDNGKEIFI